MLTEKDKKYLESLSVKKEEITPVEGPFSEEDMQLLDRQEELTEKYGDSGIRTFVESAVSSATFGLSDQAYAALGDDFKEALRERRKRNKSAALAGEIVGIAGPALFSGGSSLLAKGAGAAGKGIATAAKGAAAVEKLTASGLKKLIKDTGKKNFAREVLRKSVAKGAGSAVEGTFYGVGELIEENALGNAEFNAENLAAYAGRGALFGGLVGGSLGGIGQTVSIVVPKIKGSKIVGVGVEKIDNFKQNMTNPVYNSMKLGGFADDQIERLMVDQPKMAQNIPEVLSKAMKDGGVGYSLASNSHLLNSSRSYLKKIGKNIGKTVKAIDEEITDPNIFPKLNQVAQRQVDELEKLRPKFLNPKTGKPLSDDARKKVALIDKELDNLTSDLLDDVRYTADDLQKIKVEYHKLGKYDKLGDPTIVQDINRALGRGFREELVDLAARVRSPLGEKLQKELLDYNSLATFVNQFNRSAPDKSVFSKLRDVFFGFGAFTLGLAPIKSVSGLAGMTSAFAQSDLKNKMMVLADIERSNTKVSSKVSRLVNNFFKRTKFDKYPAISAAVLTNNPLSRKTEGELVLGKPKNEQEAVINMANNFDKINANPFLMNKMMLDANLQSSAPKTYGQLKQVAGRAFVFLDSKLPRKTLQVNPFLKKSYPISDQEIYKFKKYVKAVQDPLSVLKDLNSASISREGIEAIRFVYPTLYSEMQSSVYDALEKSGGKTSYKHRLQLGILMDMPTDLALEPESIRGLQSFYKEAQESQAGGAISAVAADKLDLSQSQATELEKVSNRRDLNRS